MVQQRLTSGAFYVCPIKQKILDKVNDLLDVDLKVARLLIICAVAISGCLVIPKEAPTSWTQANNAYGVHISWLKRGGILKAPASQEP